MEHAEDRLKTPSARFEKRSAAMNLPISRRAAIVTGAGQGIGLGIAHSLASAGLAIALTDRQADLVAAEAASLRLAGSTAIGLEHDVALRDDWERVVRRTVEELGPIDVLVNNAGISPRGTAETTDESLWDQTIAINLKGPWLGVKACLPWLKERRGTILNIGSTHATWPLKNMFAYCASKAGLLGLTRQIALEYLDFGVTCNMIAPGWVASPGEKEIQAREGRTNFPEGVRNLSTPEHVGAAVLYLISDPARLINAELLHLDAGLNVFGDPQSVHL